MFARKLLKQFDTHAEHLTRQLEKKLRDSGACIELFNRVPVDEQERSLRQIYQHVSEWLADENTPVKKEYYIELGRRRAQQGVPFSDLLAGVCAAREYLWEYVERETLLDEPADFWGGVRMLRLLDTCFDKALCFAAIGHRTATEEMQAHAVSVSAHR